MKNYFEYKHYIGTIELSTEDKVFHGKIHGINDLVTFEGESYGELEKAFREAVDDYLDLCCQCGKEPEKMYSGQLNVRIGSELHRELAQEALIKGLSLNQIIINALKEYRALKGSF